MRIVRSEAYLFSLQKIMEFIAEDSLARAFDFQSEFDDKINDLPYMPYKYKKSLYFHDKNIRDFIFKGYVIPYKIDKPHNTLTIIGITKYKKEL